MDSWGTHVPALALALQHTTGNVLELGCGDYSTPLLHALRGERLVLSVDSNPEWVARYQNLHAPGKHHVVSIADWDRFFREQMERPWGLALVDHAPGDRRAADIAKLVNVVEVLVIHDTDASCYGWKDVPWDAFGWVYTHTRWVTYATIAGYGPRPEWPALLVPGSWGPPQCWR